MLYGTILCLGDSLTRGARAKWGYPERLAGGAPLHTKWSILNHGVSGETTWQILDRAPTSVGMLNSMSGAKWMVLLAGTNDSKGQPLPEVIYRSLYEQIAAWPRRYEIPLILCTMPKVDHRHMPAFTAQSNEWIAQQNEWIRVSARILNCQPSPVVVAELEDMPTEFLCDGVHCTEAGYGWIANRIRNTIWGEE